MSDELEQLRAERDQARAELAARDHAWQTWKTRVLDDIRQTIKTD